MKNDTIYLRTNDQVALYSHELVGQISDGHWENSNPYMHWERPCRATVVLDPEKLAINFPTKRTYNFLSRDLLQVVRERMKVLVQMSRAFGVDDARIYSDYFFEFADNYKTYVYKAPVKHWVFAHNEAGEFRHAGPYYDKIRKILTETPKSAIDAALAVPYTNKDLTNDLRTIKAAFGNRIYE